ncbi:MAG TPA: DUF4350 domain-containing protein [Haliangiales bacterium]|nr:DUF4350 domain-containing protein [Haliangiales bacterium]
MRAAALVVFVVGVGVARPSPAIAAEADYDVASRAWNGLADFRALAAGAGYAVEATNDLTWESLAADRDVLFLLYPTSQVEPVQLGSFIRAGGRVLVADDFGRADEALARLGLLRRPAHTVRARRWDGNPNLPIAEPRAAGHPLARDVRELVTNHPSVFTAEGGDVVFGFSGGDAVVVAGDLGTGRWVALSDPSVLINDMLAFDGNLAFALNLVHWLRPPGGTARILVCTGDFRIHGETPRLAEAGSLNEILAAAGAALDDVNDYLPSEALLRLLGGLGAAGGVLVLALVAARARGPQKDASFARAGGEARPTDWDDPATRNFALPAVVLRETMQGRVAPELLADLPTRGDLPVAFVSRRAFVEAYDSAKKASHGH